MSLADFAAKKGGRAAQATKPAPSAPTPERPVQRKVTILLTEQQHRRLRRLALDLDSSIQQIAMDGFDTVFIANSLQALSGDE